jgi:hypothetical protein
MIKLNGCFNKTQNKEVFYPNLKTNAGNLFSLSLVHYTCRAYRISFFYSEYHEL